jgi:hypothetical protein
METRLKLDKEHWYEYVLKLVETSHEANESISWNQQVQTDTTIPNNKPNIIGDYEEGTCMAIDAALSRDRNVVNKEAEKFLKHKDLNNSNTVMWNVKTTVIPEITRATGTVLNHSENTEQRTGKARNQGTTQTDTLGTAYIL